MKRILSLGAGVQSSTIFLMSCLGELPKLDAAIFADTQFEPHPVYENLYWLCDMGAKYGIQVSVRTWGNIYEDSLLARMGKKSEGGNHMASLPWFVDNGSGGRGRITRQCTKHYKLEVIERFNRREVLELKPRQRAPRTPVIEQWIGISMDEAHRAKHSRLPFVVNQYPLLGWPVEMLPAPMTRAHCLEWLACNFPKRHFPRSACIGCPFRSDAEWRDMRKNNPADWTRAVEFDAKIRKAGGMRGDSYTHRKLKQLDEAIGEKDNLPSLFGEECEGLCGV